jgi:hypothetical protein
MQSISVGKIIKSVLSCLLSICLFVWDSPVSANLKQFRPNLAWGLGTWRERSSSCVVQIGYLLPVLCRHLGFWPITAFTAWPFSIFSRSFLRNVLLLLSSSVSVCPSCGQTVHRWSPIFWILVYLYTWHEVVQSEFRQRLEKKTVKK